MSPSLSTRPSRAWYINLPSSHPSTVPHCACRCITPFPHILLYSHVQSSQYTSVPPPTAKWAPSPSSQYHTTPTPLLPIARKQTLPRRRLKHIIHALARQRRTLEILLRAYPSPHVFALVRRQEFLGPFPHFFYRDRVVSQVFFEADEDDRDAGAAFEDFGMPTKTPYQLVAH